MQSKQLPSRNNNDWSGFSLIEVLVATLILALVMMAFIPLLLYLHQNMESNRIRAVAYNLAKTALEQIRATAFDDIGTFTYQTDANGNYVLDGNGNKIVEYGSPAGNIPQEIVNATSLKGIAFNIQTSINWVDDPANAGGQDQNSPNFNPIRTNYLDVVVTVTTPSMPGIVQQSLVLHSYSALEGEEEAFPGGNILVKTVRGWISNPAFPITPATNIDIDLTTGPSAPESNPTDNQFGECLFAKLSDGAYTVHADPSAQGMMVKPSAGQTDQSVSVTEATTQPVTLEVEYPCHLSLQLFDNVDYFMNGIQTPVDGATVLLSWPIGMEDQQIYNLASNSNTLSAAAIGNLWPVGAGYSGNYDILVQSVPGYRNYRLRSDHPDVWTGVFSQPGDEMDLNLYLVLLPSVTVTDSQTGKGINGATVTWFTDTYTWNAASSQWSAPVESTIDPVNDSVTSATFNGTDGVALLPDAEITDNVEAPAAGQEKPGSTYTCYGLEVSAPGYYDQSTGLTFKKVDSAFWVNKLQQMETDGGVQNDQTMIRTVDVSLDPVPPPPS